MKKLLTFISTFLAMGSLTYMLLSDMEITNKHLIVAIFDAVVIITMTIQRENQNTEE